MADNETSDIRDDIAAAMDKASPEAVEAPVEVVEAAPEPAPVVEETAQEKSDRERDEKGRFVAKTTEEAPAIAPEKAKPAPAKQTELPLEATPEAPPPPPKAELKAPVSWKPAAREKWAGLPPDIQEEAVRIDREVRKTMADAAESRQFREQFQQHIVTPYEPIFRSMGMDPLQGTGVAVQSYAQLAAGPPGVKVQIIADAIKRFGVDIAALDAALSGQPAPTPQQGYQPPAPQQQFRDPRVDQLLAQQTQALQQRAQTAIQEISGEEFYDDVKEVMADILEVAGKRGVSMSMKDAYNRACWANPDVAEVMTQRQAQKQAGNPTGSIQRAKAAASSIKGSPVTPPNGTGSSGDMKSDIEAAWSRVQGR